MPAGQGRTEQDGKRAYPMSTPWLLKLEAGPSRRRNLGSENGSGEAEMRPPGGKGIRKMPKHNGKGLQRRPANPGEGKGPRGIISRSHRP